MLSAQWLLVAQLLSQLGSSSLQGGPLLRGLRDHGVWWHPSIDVEDIPGCGRGVVAKDNIKKGTGIMASRLIFGPQSVSVGLKAFFDQLISSSASDPDLVNCTHGCQMAALLAVGIEHEVLAEQLSPGSSPIGRYVLGTWPVPAGDPGGLVSFDDDMAEVVSRLPTGKEYYHQFYGSLHLVRMMLQHMPTAIMPAQAEPQRVEFWHAVLRQRIHGLKGTEGEVVDCIAVGLDVLNHVANDSEGVIAVMPKPERFSEPLGPLAREYVAQRDYAAGEQIFISYGDMGHFETFLRYDFVPLPRWPYRGLAYGTFNPGDRPSWKEAALWRRLCPPGTGKNIYSTREAASYPEASLLCLRASLFASEAAAARAVRARWLLPWKRQRLSWSMAEPALHGWISVDLYVYRLSVVGCGSLQGSRDSVLLECTGPR
ncbi:unnamed protein product [Prorocentrum cordatum]|uniref:SET domain-containing protein n=1 Tax=Prorocentrum cordatum TaxID=2364126 RepID=A0ABN9VTN3_9DINO|nr:unnamed protein product [Polarella glacialis]